MECFLKPQWPSHLSRDIFLERHSRKIHKCQSLLKLRIGKDGKGWNSWEDREMFLQRLGGRSGSLNLDLAPSNCIPQLGSHVSYRFAPVDRHNLSSIWKKTQLEEDVLTSQGAS